MRDENNWRCDYCAAQDHWFDRSICLACETMHTRCATCGRATEGCRFERTIPPDHPMTDLDLVRYAATKIREDGKYGNLNDDPFFFAVADWLEDDLRRLGPENMSPKGIDVARAYLGMW